MMATGNPKGIQGLDDLIRDDIRFINRQPGSGTRQWLDESLKKEGIASNRIHGYGDMINTHTEIARKIASGKADAGVGLQASATMFKLDFIPLFNERYDLVTDRSNLALTSPILDLIQSRDFRNDLSQFPGYDNSHSGELIQL